MKLKCDFAPMGRLTTATLNAWLVVGAVGLGGCATPGQDATPGPAGTPARSPAAPAAPPPVAPAPAPVEVPAGPPTVSAVQAAQRLVAAAIELLEAGNEEQASAELQRALQSDPGNRLAANLLRQISADPLQLLGRESFAYRVQAGESLSRIAQRFLGDVHLFYALARYNDIKVPRQLAGGQLIRIPGKAPSPTPAAPPAAAVSVPTPAPPPPSSAPPPTAADKADQDKAAAIARATRAARSAFARQDLNAAIKGWDTVLELDPYNSTARLERQKAVDLKERLTKVPK